MLVDCYMDRWWALNIVDEQTNSAQHELVLNVFSKTCCMVSENVCRIVP